MPKYQFYFAEEFGVSDRSLDLLDAEAGDLDGDLNYFAKYVPEHPLHRITIHGNTAALAFIPRGNIDETLYSGKLKKLLETELFGSQISTLPLGDFPERDFPVLDEFSCRLNYVGLNRNFTVKISEYVQSKRIDVDLSDPALAIKKVGREVLFPTALKLGNVWAIGIPFRDDGEQGYVPPQTKLLSPKTWREVVADFKGDIRLSNHERVRERISRLPQIEVGEHLRLR